VTVDIRFFGTWRLSIAAEQTSALKSGHKIVLGVDGKTYLLTVGWRNVRFGQVEPIFAKGHD
jgi:hypothetical protein